MSRLREMIKELCPDGVEYRKLGEVCNLVAGGDVPKNRFSEHITDEYRVPVYSNGVEEKSLYGYTDIPAITEPCVTISARGTIGYAALRIKPFFPIIRLICVIPDESINVRFLFHVLKMSTFRSPQTGIPQLTIPMVKKHLVPVPPLPIQNEIVKLLDNFTELTAELTAELMLRKKQYNFYRDSLLNFDRKNNKVEWKTLGEVCDTLSGYPFDSSQFVNNGIRLMRGMNVKRGFLDFQEGNNRYWKNIDGLDKYILEADDIIIAMDGSLVGQSYGLLKKEHLPLLLVQRVARVRSQKGNPHYVYYYISSGKFTEYVNAKRTAGAVPHISLKDIENFKIPFPDIEEQNKIAAILDHFDALTSDLTQGLPAEIAARKKQYEYYRDKLLTFRRKGA